MGRRAKAGECSYCGLHGPLTVDHIPPKNLFAPESRTRLLAVPSCRPCNGGASQDDEYLRTMLSLKDGAHEGADLRFARDASLRALSRPGFKGLTVSLLKNVRQKEKFSGHMFVGHAPAYTVDLDRIERVVGRVVKGMYWWKTGMPFPTDYAVIIYSASGFSNPDIRALISVDKLTDFALSGERYEVGDEAFGCSFRFLDDNPLISVWFLQFYRAEYFIALTLPKENVVAKRRRNRGTGGLVLA